MFWRVNDVSLVFRTIWIRVEFLTTRIWTFLGVWTQIIAWSRCFGGGRNMRLFGWDVFFLPRIAVIHLTHMNGIFVRRGSQKSTHHFSRRKTSPQFPRAVGSGEGHCRSCSKGGGGVVFPMEGRSSTLTLGTVQVIFYVLHPGRLTWNIIMEVWKINFLFKWVICRFYVTLPGCNTASSSKYHSWAVA